MATLASLIERFTAADRNAGAPARGRARASAARHRLPALPNQDVYFWVKKIDNSRVVRQADPGARKACWRSLRLASLAVTLVVGLLVPNAYRLLAGYQIHELEQENARLRNEQRLLELEEARLVSPERLQELARARNFVDPAPERVVYLQPQADGSLALNVNKR